MEASRNSAGTFKPTLILHGGAGAITRSHLPPSLYARYHRSLLDYLTNTKSLLDDGAAALDAAVHAVSLMEDDELFNCGRGSVFNLKGDIEMEASVMVASVRPDVDCAGKREWGGLSKETGSGMGNDMRGFRKRAAAVSLIRETRHPIRLAKAVLLEGDAEDAKVSSMHSHLSGRDVEEWGWRKGLEKKEKEWFWTRRRWEEHRRGLGQESGEKFENLEGDMTGLMELPSQGTVGAVCLDRWGNLAVATSTGGLTNKKPGRIGDTPSVGAGFWAESWNERDQNLDESWIGKLLGEGSTFLDCFRQCFSPALIYSPKVSYQRLRQTQYTASDDVPAPTPPQMAAHMFMPRPVAPRPVQRRAIAMSGTGNGDSFLRTNATRSAAARCRYGEGANPLSKALAAIAGPGGELQQSAGSRFGTTGEGEGGIIGIEVLQNGSADIVFDFNCGGMWRAWYDHVNGQACPRVMVFREEYQWL